MKTNVIVNILLRVWDAARRRLKKVTGVWTPQYVSGSVKWMAIHDPVEISNLSSPLNL
jgi:hypothetical protein